MQGFERRPWEAISVEEVMHPRVLTCPPDAGLRELARIMATHAIHAVVVVEDENSEDQHVAGVVTDLVLADAALSGTEHTAGELAQLGAPMVSVGWTLEQAAREMLRSGNAHVVVIDGRGIPIGMLSSLDLARVTAWGQT